MASSPSHEPVGFWTDNRRLFIEVELDHLYLGPAFNAPGDSLSDEETLRRLHAELTDLVARFDDTQS